MSEAKSNTDNKSQVLDKGLWGMVKPMFIEWAIMLSIPLTDTFFLSRISNDAAAGAGMVTPLIIGSFVIMEALCIGGAAVAGQRVGANEYHKGNMTFGALFFLVCIALMVLVTSLVTFAPNLANMMKLPSGVFGPAVTYLSIASFMLVGWALSTVYKSIINTYGHPKWNLYATGLLTVTNILFNYVVVFGKFGVPKLGVTGVAMASTTAAMASLFFLVYIAAFRLRIKIPYFQSIKNLRELLPQICRIGVPSMIEPLSFQLSAVCLNAMIATLGSNVMAARVYTHNTFTFCLVVSISFAIATQTIVAQLIGKGRYESAYAQLFESIRMTLIMVGIIAGIFLIAHKPITAFFSGNSVIVKMAFVVFLFYFITEFPRSVNVVASASLRASGDAWFISVCSVVVTWLIAVPAAFMLGIQLEFGLSGVLFALLADESLRAGVNVWRWRQRKWQKYGVYSMAQGASAS